MAFALWLTLRSLVHNRSLTLTLEKVPAHFHNLLNDRADWLASRGHNSPLFSLSSADIISLLPVTPCWQSQLSLVPIDIDSHQFLRTI